MQTRTFASFVCGATALLFLQRSSRGETPKPKADFLFIGTYHMDNPGRDVHNMNADDVLSAKRQGEILEVAQLLEEYKPTKVFVEADAKNQQTITQHYKESCQGTRPFTKNEVEQLGFRVACANKLDNVYAVDWNELGPFKDENSVDYQKAAESHQQLAQYQEFMSSTAAWNKSGQSILKKGTVLDMLEHLNSDEWLQKNAEAYHRIAMFGTQSDPIGANWVGLWFIRNLTIFINIARLTEPGDRVLVIYGAGHGNCLRQLAKDSGIYKIYDTCTWLSNKRSNQN